MRDRLTQQTLSRLPPEVSRPSYDRARLRAGIVHLGMGAFHRAHQALVTDLAMQATGDLSWGIVGVSLRSADTRDALQPQDCLYTVAIRDAAPDGTLRESLRVVGSVMEVLVAPENPSAVLERIAHADTRILSLTITEKGYSHEPASGRLRVDDPEVAHDLARPDAPRGAIGMIAYGLQRRRAAGLPGLTLLSCDNLPANGDTLRGLVLEFAGRVDVALRQWIAARCTFPNAMVDRIVPRTTDEDRQRIATRLGLHDAWPVVGEPFLEWVIEDRYAAGRPPWGQPGGARFVQDVAPFERLKLRMVNGPQSTMAYLGALAGMQTNNEVVAHPALRGFVDTLMREEIAPTLGAVPDVDLDVFRARLLARLANPALPHRTQQIAMDGSQKVPQRLLATIGDRIQAAQCFDRLALAVAAWLQYLRGRDEQGRPYPIHDPLAVELAALLVAADRVAAYESGEPARQRARIAHIASYAPVFGELGSNAAFIDAVATQAQRLQTLGVIGAVQRHAA